MSIFAKIKSSKKAAQEHKAQKAAEDAAEATKSAPTPYHHVPRHAAQDALAGTPGTADKQAIREANRQRTAYGRDTFYSSASPSLSRIGSDAGSVMGMQTAGNSRSSSRARAVRPPLQDRRSHPGYASYQNLSLTTQERRSRANSRHGNVGKSPLSTAPITPRDSSSASSAASSFSSTRSYTDPIIPSAPFSERLETISSNRSVQSGRTAPRTPLYAPKTDISKPKPWEVAAAKKAKATETEVKVQEITKPEPAVTKRGRFMGIGRKQPVQVAAC